jgi:hypothetical protein
LTISLEILQITVVVMMEVVVLEKTTNQLILKLLLPFWRLLLPFWKLLLPFCFWWVCVSPSIMTTTKKIRSQTYQEDNFKKFLRNMI